MSRTRQHRVDESGNLAGPCEQLEGLKWTSQRWQMRHCSSERPCTCQRRPNFGSDPHFVIVTVPSSGGEEDAVAEQVEPGVAVHLPLEDLEPVDVALDRS
jgi:hypothetical protein